MADKLTTFKCRLSRKYGCHKLLEPQGPVKVCNGMARPLLLCFTDEEDLSADAHQIGSYFLDFVS
jgi:hypothetical protein